MHVFSQMCIFDLFYEKSKEEKRSEGNPRSSKQWQSFYEMSNSGFLYFSTVMNFWKKYQNQRILLSIWLDPGNEIGDFH